MSICCRRLAYHGKSSFETMWFISLPVGQSEHHIFNPSFHSYPPTLRVFRDKFATQAAFQKAKLLTGLLLSSSEHHNGRNLHLGFNFTRLQNVHLYIAVFGSGEASDQAPIGATAPFYIHGETAAFSVCLPVEQCPTVTDIRRSVAGLVAHRLRSATNDNLI